MEKIHRIKSVLLFIAMSVVFMTGCGEAATPEETAVNFIKAVFNQDVGTMKKLASEEYRKQIEENEGEIKSSQLMIINNLKQKGLSKEDIKELISNTYATPVEYAYNVRNERFAVVYVKSIINHRVTLNEVNGVWKVSTAFPG